MVGRETPMERAISATFSPPKTFLTADHFSSGEVKVMVMMLLQEKILSEHHSSGLGKIKSYCKVYCDITIVQKLGSYASTGWLSTHGHKYGNVFRPAYGSKLFHPEGAGGN